MQFSAWINRGRFLWIWLGVALLAGSSAGADNPYRETTDREGWWIFGRPPAKATPSEQMVYAQSLEKAGRPRAAAKQYLKLVRHWPQAPEAAPAQLQYARWFEDRRKWSRAFDEYQRLFDNYAGTFPYEAILDRQFTIATNLMNRKKGKFLFFHGFTAPERAIPLLEKIVLNGPGWKHAAEAQYLIGRAHELNQEYEEAIAAYITAEHRYPATPWAPQAAFGNAWSYYQLALESKHNEQALENAWAAWTVLLQRYPDHPRQKEAVQYRDDMLARRARLVFDRAVFYDRIAKRPESARIGYESFLKQFPNAAEAPRARERLQALAPKEEKGT